VDSNRQTAHKKVCCAGQKIQIFFLSLDLIHLKSGSQTMANNPNTTPKITSPHTTLSQSQELSRMKDLRAVFDFIDGNHDGKIEWNELKESMNLLGPALTESELKEFFRRMDKGDSKAVTFEVFAQTLSAYIPPRVLPSPKSARADDEIQLSKPVDHSALTISRLQDLIPSLRMYPNPMSFNPVQWNNNTFISNDHRILESVILTAGDKQQSRQFMRSGPRREIAYDIPKVKAAIVTCGGLCPGLNTVIREIVMCLNKNYGVSEVYGVQFGYQGFY